MSPNRKGASFERKEKDILWERCLLLEKEKGRATTTTEEEKNAGTGKKKRSAKVKPATKEKN